LVVVEPADPLGALRAIDSKSQVGTLIGIATVLAAAIETGGTVVQGWVLEPESAEAVEGIDPTHLVERLRLRTPQSDLATAATLILDRTDYRYRGIDVVLVGHGNTTYEVPCGRGEERRVKGALISLTGVHQAQPLKVWLQSRLGQGRSVAEPWSHADTRTVNAMLANLRRWKPSAFHPDADQRALEEAVLASDLRFDENRAASVSSGCVPIETDLGPAVLSVLPNSWIGLPD
jgi:hypothetical protein